MDIHEIIDLVKSRPSMYLGRPSISALRSFLDGWTACERFNHLQTPIHDLLPLDFSFMNEFAAHYYGDDLSPNAGWAFIILEHCGGDEKKALKKFFDIYEEFRGLEVQVCKRAVLTDEHRLYHETNGAYKVDENGIRISQLYVNPRRLYKVIFSSSMSVCIVECGDKRRLIKTPTGGVDKFVSDNFGEDIEWKKCAPEDYEAALRRVSD